MTYQITDMGNGTHQIQVSFFDEGVELEGETTVKGTPEDAERTFLSSSETYALITPIYSRNQSQKKRGS